MLSIQRKQDQPSRNLHIQKIPSSSPVTPLTNLFAYIRDLFTTVKGGLRFDESDAQWWPLQQLLDISADKQVIDREQFHFQWKNPEKALLNIRRGEAQNLPSIPPELSGWLEVIEEAGQAPQLLRKEKKISKFEEVASRMRAFKAFKQQVDGKSLDELAGIYIPPSLNPWIKLSQEDEKVFVSKIAEAEEQFGDDELRKEFYTSYSRSFEKKLQGQAHFHQINRLYDALHDLYFQLQSTQDRQITLSFGLISGKIGGQDYKNFLFHLPLKLSLEKQELRLEADTFAHVITCEQNFTEPLEEHFSGEGSEKTLKRKLKVLHEVDAFNTDSRELNFEADYLRGSFYASAIRMLEVFPKIEDLFFSEKGLNFDVPNSPKGDSIQFSFSPVIQTRLLNTGAHIAQDAERIIANIHELGSQDMNEQIPDFFKKLFTLRKPGNPLRIAYKSMAKETSKPSISEAEPERFLFPLAYNKEQLNIAQQLMRQDAVTVQGPPGTGKSHTIANLTSHFVAQGKSILIVSKNAKALEVIREKLPQEIRSLVVAFLKGNEYQEMLRSSIDAVKDNLSRKYDETEIDRMEESLLQLEQAFQDTFAEVKSRIGSQHKELSLLDPFLNQERKASALDWIEERSRLGEVKYFQDEVGILDSTDDWAEKLIKALDFLNQTQIPEADLVFPPEEVLPNRDHLESLIQKLTLLEENPELGGYKKVQFASLTDELLAKIAEIPKIHQDLKSYNSLIKNPGFQLRKLKQVLEFSQPIFLHIREEEKALLRYEINWGEVLPELDPDLRLKEIRNLFEKYGESGKISLLKKKFLNETQKAFYTCQVNGLPITGLEELLVLERSLTQSSRIKQLHILLNNFAKSIQQSIEKEAIEQTFEHWDALEVLLQNRDQINQQLGLAGLEKLSEHAEEREAQITFFSGLGDYKQYLQQVAELENICEGLTGYPSLSSTISERNILAFDEEIQKIRDAQAWETESQKYADLLQELEGLMPNTLAFLQKEPVEGLSEVQINREILALKIQQLLDAGLEALGNPALLIEKLQQIQQDIQKKTVELIAYKTWYHKQKQIGDEQRSALTAWRNDLVNIGKGHGKNAEKNMNSAISNMRLAREVVPVWVMQQDTAISFFPDPDPGQFDLLIVDEASQCDISMLNLIYRSKKCIIVGDENQTSVATQARLFPIGRTNQLLDRYLIKHPFKQQFNINNRSSSVYSLSGVIYPNIISLREHFRCRPELIGFSNEYVYDNQIIPLKTATDKLYGAAAEVHYVEDDPKNPKKPAIVKACVQLLRGLLEDVESGKLPKIPTLGILCLDSSNHDHQDLLNRELGRHPLIKAHKKELKLLVGTSREFQGDERDIMILTTTGSHSFSPDGKIRAPRSVMGEDMARIYNVAASRARDKAILLHSIHPEAVAKMKPVCFRKRMIDYYSLQMMQEEKDRPRYTAKDMHPSLGNIGQQVFQCLEDMGLGEDLVPQYKLGPYQMDLALIKDGQKRAIFFDVGESFIENLEQQLILERAGWLCYRVQELAWTIQADNAIAHLSNWVGNQTKI